MTPKTIVISVFVLVAAAIVVFNYVHKKRVKYSEEDLSNFIAELFEEKGIAEMPYEQFVRAVQRNYNISLKGAMVLAGKAQKHRIVVMENQQVVRVSS